MLEGPWEQIALPAFAPGDVPWSAESGRDVAALAPPPANDRGATKPIDRR
jgi:hypothetical protein